jgi:hypothetical protein
MLRGRPTESLVPDTNTALPFPQASADSTQSNLCVIQKTPAGIKSWK